ncbi:MAG: hypothetical protein JNK76_05225 [Planctomycetales bacterium]|nr:hypothetical protein [Planctomycetales bacterium]MBN8627292.1 hypothetical protein [Planctomycetota bacterium]
MTQFLAIVIYRSVVAGVRTSTLDFQVRWFTADDEAEVRTRIEAEPLEAYIGGEGDQVLWELAEIMAVERFEPQTSGDEVIGFISRMDDLLDL